MGWKEQGCEQAQGVHTNGSESGMSIEIEDDCGAIKEALDAIR